MPINSQAVACENVIDLVISTAVTNLNITVKKHYDREHTKKCHFYKHTKGVLIVNIQKSVISINIRRVFGKFFQWRYSYV